MMFLGLNWFFHKEHVFLSLLPFSALVVGEWNSLEVNNLALLNNPCYCYTCTLV